MEPKTIKVVDEDCAGGFRIINEADRQPEDVLFDQVGTDLNGDGLTSAAELRFALDSKGITYKKNDNKATLQALLDAANKG